MRKEKKDQRDHWTIGAGGSGPAGLKQKEKSGRLFGTETRQKHSGSLAEYPDAIRFRQNEHIFSTFSGEVSIG